MVLWLKQLLEGVSSAFWGALTKQEVALQNAIRLGHTVSREDLPCFSDNGDVENLMSRFNHDRDFLNEIFVLFSQMYPIVLSKLNEALQNNDAEQVSFLAHQLKSSISNFSTKTPFQMALAMEREARMDNLTEAKVIYSDLVIELGRLEQCVRKLLGPG